MAGNPSRRKKVVIRKLNKELVKGYVDSDTFSGESEVEVLTLEGRLCRFPLEEIKGIYFVRDFDGVRERPERKVYQSRPRLTGLWVRMTFKDSEILDGLISQDLLTMDPRGFHVTPPDLYSNNLRIYVPRTALATMSVLDVITNGPRRPYHLIRQARRKSTESSQQIALFSGQAEPTT